MPTLRSNSWMQIHSRIINDTNKELLKLLYNDNIVSIVDNYHNASKKHAGILSKSLRLFPEERNRIFNIVNDNVLVNELTKFLVDEYYRYVLKDIIRYNIKKPGRCNRSACALTAFKDKYVLLGDNHIDMDNSVVRRMDIYKQLKTPSEDNILRVNALIRNMIDHNPKLVEYYKRIKDKNGLFKNTDPESIEISRFYDVSLRMYLNYFGKYIYAAKIAIAKLYDIYKNASDTDRLNYISISSTLLSTIMIYTDIIISDMDYDNSALMTHEVFTKDFVLEDILAIFPDYDKALNADIKERRGF